MLRLVLFLIAVAAVAGGLSWLADRPGSLVVNWQGYEAETSVFRAVVILVLLIGLVILLWSILVQIWRSPASVGAFFNRRRQVRGLDALSSGMIAIGAGDRMNATRFAVQARKSLPNEPLTHLLRAQAAQLSGDRATSRRIFEAMLGSPETEQLGLRGLFLEAEREGEREAARQFAQRAVNLNPKLAWAVDALFELQCKERDWDGALATLAIAKRNQHHDKAAIDRKRAVLLTAQAQALEESNADRATSLALEAHHLAHDLIPAAAIAGRVLAARGNTKRAARVIERTWRRAPHPDLAVAYAYARIGDSPRDRLDRVRRLAALHQHSIESPVALAVAAIEARDFDTARHVLQPLTNERMTQRVCTLMARIEGEQHGDKGLVREWLARAIHAPRDPAWTADGVVSDRWEPTSPVTGQLDAFQWRVPVEALESSDTAVLARKLEEIVRLGSVAKPALESDPDADDAPRNVIDTAPAAEPRPDRTAAHVGEPAESASVAPPKQSVVAADADARPVDAKPVAADASAAKADPAPAPASAPAAAGTVHPSATVATAATTAPPAKPTVASTAALPQQVNDVTPVASPGAAGVARAQPAAPTTVSAAAAPTVADKAGPDKTAADDTGAIKSTPAHVSLELEPAAKPAESPAAEVSSVTSIQARKERTAGEPNIFVAPRPPDDPGVKPVEKAADDGREAALRAAGAKR